MVRARRAFFDAGHYRPVIDAVAEAVATAAPDATDVLDAGCGEGTYLAAVVAATGAVGWGIDVSKPAVRLAARRHRDHHYGVASSYRLPFADGDLDAVVAVFAPRHFPEWERVLHPHGVAVVASPGPDHLAGLRALLYERPAPHEPRPHVADDDTVGAVRVRFELDLDDPSDVANLLQMTPYWWQATVDQQQQVASRPLATPVDVWVTTHRRSAHPGGLTRP
ncbi:MAG TPA: methyltransferase domain-containing protein [Microthrixaceae bacterium]|nr:methyltransferase domain-containing protein [Microthrixaceae bacterium]